MTLSALEGPQKDILLEEFILIRSKKEEEIHIEEQDPDFIDQFQIEDATPTNTPQVNEWISRE